MVLCLLNNDLSFFFSRWMRNQKLDILPKIVCWSFAICPSRSVHCFCLLCVRLPCILVSSWLWLMTNADQKSEGRRIERGQGNNSHPFLPGSDFFTIPFFSQGAPVQQPLSHSYSSMLLPLQA